MTLSILDRIRIVRLGWQSECAAIGKAHLATMARWYPEPLTWRALPNSVQACEELGRRAVHEHLLEAT